MKSFTVLLICALFITACQPQPETTVIINQPSYSATLSDDAHYLLISTANSDLQLWDLTTHTQKYRWFHGEQKSQAIDTAISTNQQYAASLSRDSVALWSIEDGRSLGWWSLPANGQTVAIADSGALLIGLTDGSVMSLAPSQNRLIKFLGHSEKVNSVAISRNGELALSGANDNQVILWHATTGQPIHTWSLPSRVINVSLSQQGELAFASDSTNQAIIWNTQDGSQHSQLNIHRRTHNFSSARFTRDNSKLLTGTPAREVSVWRVLDGKMLVNWRVSRTEHAQIKGAVVYSVAEDNHHQVSSISSNGLLETWPMPPL